jgi:hypothetical protein
MLTAMKHPKVRRGAWALAASGVALAVYNIAVGGDDEDGEPYYLKIPQWVRDRNFVLMWPKGFGMDGKYIMIPLAYGYSMFHVVGARFASMLYGGEKPGKAMGAIASSVADAFDPIGHDQNAVAALAPTVMRPWIHIQTNENWTGRPINPTSPNNRDQPDSQRYFSTSSGFAKSFAEHMNRMSGGNNYKPGWIDWHPGSIDHTLQAAGGGLGRFVKGTVENIYGALQGDFDPEKAPIARRFIGEVDDAGRSQAYREDADPERKRAAAVKAAQKDRSAGRNVDESDRFIEENAGQPGANIFARADRRIGRLRDEARKIEADTQMDAAAKRERVESIRTQIRDIQNEARKEYRDLKRQ